MGQAPSASFPFLVLDPGDAIQLVLDLCDEDIHQSSLHCQPSAKQEGQWLITVSNLQLRAITPR